MNAQRPLTAEAIIAEAARLLENVGHYTVVRDLPLHRLTPERTLLAEDSYGVVLLLVFDTWSQLEEAWSEGEASLSERMSERLTKADPKSWEGYLVLLTPELVGPAAQQEANEIRYDTSRIRKLVATGDEVKTISDVERALLPLLPIEPTAVASPESDALSQLPAALAEQGIDQQAAEIVVSAFLRSEPLLEPLRDYLDKS